MVKKNKITFGIMREAEVPEVFDLHNICTKELKYSSNLFEDHEEVRNMANDKNILFLVARHHTDSGSKVVGYRVLNFGSIADVENKGDQFFGGMLGVDPEYRSKFEVDNAGRKTLTKQGPKIGTRLLALSLRIAHELLPPNKSYNLYTKADSWGGWNTLEKVGYIDNDWADRGKLPMYFHKRVSISSKEKELREKTAYRIPEYEREIYKVAHKKFRHLQEK